jgi:phosphatidylethanolamine/phosphatidyl-N-methylethanolamine N-methyltransferase
VSDVVVTAALSGGKGAGERAMSFADRGLAFWERHAARYDRSMKLLGRPMARALSLTAEAVAGASAVLEVAAGTGLFAAAIAPRVGRLVATDYAEAMVALLRERVAALGLANVECERADIYALRFPPGSFDAVVAANVLHLVPDLPAALAALRRALRPDGRLVAPTFCHDETPLSWLASRAAALGGFPAHRRFSAGSLRRALEEAGLVVERTETVPGLFPIGFVQGRFEAALTSGASPPPAGAPPPRSPR